VCLRVVRRLRAEHGRDRDVWCWTGYRFEELLAWAEAGHDDKAALLAEVDVLVDGRFELAQRDLGLAFRGSRNQRVLDAPASLRAGLAVPWARVPDAPHPPAPVDRRALL
jgi:anaerobic ribonucleoside-triphosphate reductase activating protein